MPPLPPDSTEITPHRRTSPWIIVGAIVAIIAAIIAIFVFVDAHETARKKKLFDDGWSKFSGCFVDQVPASPEAAASQVRAIQLAVASQAKTPIDTWPYRCGQAADDLYMTLVNNQHVAPGGGDFAAALVVLKTKMMTVEPGSIVQDWSPQILAAYQAAKTENISLHAVDPAAKTEHPPAPLKPLLTLADLKTHKPLAKKPISPVVSEMNRVGDTAFLVDDKMVEGGPFVCLVSDANLTVPCKRVPASVLRAGGRLSLVGERDTGVMPPIVLDDHGGRGIFSSDGTPMMTDEKFGWVYARADATFVVSYRDSYTVGTRTQLRLRQQKKGASPVDVMFDVPAGSEQMNKYYSAFLGRGFTMFHHFDGTNFDLITKPLIDSPLGLGAIAHLGAVGLRRDDESTWMTCSRKDTEVMLFKGDTTTWLTIRSGDQWSKPTPAGMIYGLEFLDSVACYDGKFTNTIGSKKSIEQNVCSFGTCQDQHLELPEAFSRAAIDLEGVVVMVQTPQERAGVEVVVAGFKDLPTAPKTLLFDGWMSDKALEKSWIRSLKVLAVSRTLVVMVSTDDGVFLVQIDRDGHVAPMDVTISE